jgi:hypothetical protein
VRTLWEKFEIKIAVNDLEVLSIQNLRQMRPFRNLYNLDISSIHNSAEANCVLIVEKKLNSILGYIKFRASAVGSELVASQRFDTFPIERMDLACLEVVEFEIVDTAWDRLGFKHALKEATLEIMNELGSDALVVNYVDKPENAASLLEQVGQSPFCSSLIFCDRYEKRAEVLDSNELIGSVADKSFFPQKLSHLLQCGLEIWSEPIIYKTTNTFSILLGHLGRNGLKQARPLSVVRDLQKGGFSAPF